MNELERLALRHIKELSAKAERMLAETSLKARQQKEPINPDKDIYPASSAMMDIGRWVDSILENKKP
jgi:hypothetical protein